MFKQGKSYIYDANDEKIGYVVIYSESENEEVLKCKTTGCRKPVVKGNYGKCSKCRKKSSPINKKNSSIKNKSSNKNKTTPVQYYKDSEKKTCDQLRAALDALDLPTDGTKDKLKRRLARATADCLDSRVKKLR